MNEPSGRARPTLPPALFRYSRDVRRARRRAAVEPQHQVAVGRHDRAVADDALAGHREVVGDGVAAQGHVHVGRVQDLDPGPGRAGLVLHRERVGRHQLVDHQLPVDLGRHRRTARPPPPAPRRAAALRPPCRFPPIAAGAAAWSLAGEQAEPAISAAAVRTHRRDAVRSTASCPLLLAVIRRRSRPGRPLPLPALSMLPDGGLPSPSGEMP